MISCQMSFKFFYLTIETNLNSNDDFYDHLFTFLKNIITMIRNILFWVFRDIFFSQMKLLFLYFPSKNRTYRKNIYLIEILWINFAEKCFIFQKKKMLKVFKNSHNLFSNLSHYASAWPILLIEIKKSFLFA